MLPEFDQRRVEREVVVIAVHSLKRAHSGDLFYEVLRFVDEDDGAAEEGDEAVFGGDGGERW
jgi:hypothetical protein